MLSELLQKLGIKSIDDLRSDELLTYQRWSVILAKPEATIEDLKIILPKELERANVELRKHENSEKRDAFYKAYCQLLDTISKIITAPAKERENLRQFLKSKYGIE